VDNVRVTVELSSVNRKQFDAVLRLPAQWAALEARCQKIIQETISRGRISGTVLVESSAGREGISIDPARAAEAVNGLRRTAKALGLADDLSAACLLKIPGLFNGPASGLSADEGFPALEKALRAALKKLEVLRLREGKILRADLLARLTLLESLRKAIQQRAPALAELYRAKLLRGLEKAGLAALASDERLLKEVALCGERCDIAEELTRLGSHLQQFRALLHGNEPAGRTLDFLAQELFREINTVGSKANDLEISGHVVQFKTELERIREQIQNIE
jgi:uncharacterized protein (TIGR00255 family)